MIESPQFTSWHNQISEHLAERDKTKLEQDRKGVDGDLAAQEIYEEEHKILIHLLDSFGRFI